MTLLGAFLAPYYTVGNLSLIYIFLPIVPYNIAVPARMVLWQHMDDLRPLGGSNIEKWPAYAEAPTRDPELLCLTTSH